jgi:hypothetical protein
LTTRQTDRRSLLDEFPFVTAAPNECQPSPGPDIAGLNSGDERVDDVIGERLDEIAKRQRHDQIYRDNDPNLPRQR